MFRGRRWRSRRASVANPGAELERDYSCAHAATTAPPRGPRRNLVRRDMGLSEGGWVSEDCRAGQVNAGPAQGLR